ncbi:type III-B CRISPR module-associated protein Cmr5 [Dehalobacterium formicoaceticum]|uniref:CRISPR type III-B/RAMP module-associated protein Cmr5 n=1 Tax=Dehalobacterium formicoaceticum TaxID=51515 RepID=A0ABT1Y1G9_9FIRM|nr:type III-B CRISPR module-associated protein Cmr5 [Dehalobacterium formicoaceticum]MCR6544717.1 type III-B CRISPR module-associated protein Cmr5 [Dehalobacterium formicoaceticum]
MKNTEDSIKGIEQGRASFAYKKVLEAKDELKGEEAKYKAYVKKIPMYIKTNGLGPTFAFVKSKDKEKAYRLIYKQTGEWLKRDANFLDGQGELIEQIINLDSASYRCVTNEVLALFNWLRRFSEGTIKGEVEDEI